MIEVSKRDGRLVKHLPILTCRIKGRKKAVPNVFCPASKLGSRIPISSCAKDCVCYKGFNFSVMYCSWMQGMVKPGILSRFSDE